MFLNGYYAEPQTQEGLVIWKVFFKVQLIPTILFLCSSGLWKFLVCTSCWDFYTRRKGAQGSWSNQPALVPEAGHPEMQQNALVFLPSDIRLSTYDRELGLPFAEGYYISGAGTKGTVSTALGN